MFAPAHAARYAKRLACLALCLCVLVMIAACGGSSSGGAAQGSGGGTTRAATGSTERTAGAAYAQPVDVEVPTTTGAGIDTSGVGEGWVGASATSAARLKF